MQELTLEWDKPRIADESPVLPHQYYYYCLLYSGEEAARRQYEIFSKSKVSS